MNGVGAIPYSVLFSPNSAHDCSAPLRKPLQSIHSYRNHTTYGYPFSDKLALSTEEKEHQLSFPSSTLPCTSFLFNQIQSLPEGESRGILLLNSGV